MIMKPCSNSDWFYLQHSPITFPAVPSGTCGSLLEEGQVRDQNWSRSTSLLGRSVGVSVCWDPWVGRQCRQGQQENQNRTQTHPACSQEWRGTEQATWQGHYCIWRCPAKHPCRPSAQEGYQEGRVNFHNHTTPGDFNHHLVEVFWLLLA